MKGYDIEMKSILDICYSEKSSQYLDIHLPESDAFPVFVYFHGGGLEGCDKADQKVLFHYLTDCGVAVVSANYRLYPKAHYPDFLYDAAAAVAWVFKNIGNYGKATEIYVGGCSAGGYLSQMLCFDGSWLAKFGITPMDISGFIQDSGQPTCHFNVLQERGLDPRRVVVDDAAPLYHVGTAETYPPMLIIVSDNDMQNRYEQTVLLVSTLKHFGHTDTVNFKVMHGTHCEYIDAVDEKGDSVYGKLIYEFMQASQKR